MAKGKKFYVVWSGLNPGIYLSWDACQAQIKGVKGAVYKSFDSKEEAERAYASSAYSYMKKRRPSQTLPLWRALQTSRSLLPIEGEMPKG